MTGEAFDPVEVDMGRSAANKSHSPVVRSGASVTSPRMTRRRYRSLCAERQRRGEYHRV